MRKKYRIRIYNYSDRSIKLERKKKFGSYIYKESAPLTKEEFYKILNGEYEFLLTSKYPLCREFYVECISNFMRPRTIVDYERVPWIMDEGTVRITFDSDVRAAVGGYDIFDSTLPTLPVLEQGHGSEIYRNASAGSEEFAFAKCTGIYGSVKVCTLL